jgi:hypothetical protein
MSVELAAAPHGELGGGGALFFGEQPLVVVFVGDVGG